MTNTPDEYEDEAEPSCEHCDGPDVTHYSFPVRSFTLCRDCDADALRRFNRESEMRDWCHGCGHLHVNRGRKCAESGCACDAHMTMTRRMVRDAFKAGIAHTTDIMGRDGRTISVADAACAHCACPKAVHTVGKLAGCERCSCDRLIHAATLDMLLPIVVVDD